MLTRDDRTVTDCLEVLESVRDLGITHIGFKDIGVDRDTLFRLHDALRGLGATTYLEVVSTGREQALASVRTAVELGVDRLMGGTWTEETLGLLHGTAIGYLPFVGRPVGHPTRLAGTPTDVAADCRRAEAAGCAGVDLLAYRATDAGPLDLVRAARAATSGRLVVAGSISGTGQIRDLAEAGADAFTIGSAAFAGSLRPDTGALTSQLEPVIAAAGAAERENLASAGRRPGPVSTGEKG